MSEVSIEITETELEQLKRDVLRETVDELSRQMGDPGRYFSSFKSKYLLDQADCEQIKSHSTSVERVTMLVETVLPREGRRGEHPYDVLIEALHRMKVHVHLARLLNQALAKKRRDLESSKRAKVEMDRSLASSPSVTTGTVAVGNPGFPAMLPPTRVGSDSTDGLATREAIQRPEPSSSQLAHSSSASSLTSPGSNSSGSYSLSSSSFRPTISKSVSVSSPMSSSGENTFAETADGVCYEIDPETGPAPILPPGYDADGRKIDHPSASCSGEEEGHPELGPGPPTPPLVTSSDGVFLQSDLMTSVEDTLTPSSTPQLPGLALSDKLAKMKRENEDLHLALEQKDMQIKQIRMEYEADIARLMEENRRLRELESQRQVLQNSGRSASQLRSPGHQPMMYPTVNQRRQGDLVWNPSCCIDRRISEPVTTLTVPAQVPRPKNLPLNNGRSESGRSSSVDSNQQLSWDGMPPYVGGYLGHSPENSLQRMPMRAQSGHTPNSDYPRDSLNHQLSKPRLSGSIDDLITEDRLSLQSNGSGGKGGFYLPSVRNTPATFV